MAADTIYEEKNTTKRKKDSKKKKKKEMKKRKRDDADRDGGAGVRLIDEDHSPTKKIKKNDATDGGSRTTPGEMANTNGSKTRHRSSSSLDVDDGHAATVVVRRAEEESTEDKICKEKEKRRKKKKHKKKKSKKKKTEKNHLEHATSEDTNSSIAGASATTSSSLPSDARRNGNSTSNTASTASNNACGDNGDDNDFRPYVESSALDYHRAKLTTKDHETTLLLFYQYQEPDWTAEEYKVALEMAKKIGAQCEITGRMRIAKEGFNCTLTGTRDSIYEFCQSLRRWNPNLFRQTEFKLTHDLPNKQRFSNFKVIPVRELVHYGLDGEKAPPIHKYHGTHLEPRDFHRKLEERDSIVIDVRNHYEAKMGHFDPPTQNNTDNSASVTGKADASDKETGCAAGDGGAKGGSSSSGGGGSSKEKYIDPLMRKSTEFPIWLDDPNTLEKMRNKQVMLYCTGGIRCEKFSSLLNYRMQNDPTVKKLNIRGVYQLQGGIDKYFKEFPDGGYWKGKNYVFDKRFAHPPPALDGDVPESEELKRQQQPVGQCEACNQPKDLYRGKRRCPTCGVPSLICRECWKAHEDGTRKIDKSVRCDLCVKQKIQSKRDLREKEEREIKEYEAKLAAKGLLQAAAAPNPDNVTRLFLRNMCRKNMTEEVLMRHMPGITHIVWRNDRKTGQFTGQGWVEMKSPEAAARAMCKSGDKVLGRPLYVEYQPPDGKDAWPPPSSAV